MRQLPPVGSAAPIPRTFIPGKCLSATNVTIIDHFCRSVEFYLKKGLLTQEDAQKRYISFEEQRKMDIELVLRELFSQNSRTMNRKATSVLQ